MDWVRILLTRFRGLFRKGKLDQELDAEVRAHLDLLTDENICRGMTPEEARYAARRAFGGVEQVKEAYRAQRGLPLLETLVQDIRFALRTLRKSLGLTLVVVAVLGIGIGANVAVFAVLDAAFCGRCDFRNPNVWFRSRSRRRRVAPCPFPIPISSMGRDRAGRSNPWALRGCSGKR